MFLVKTFRVAPSNGILSCYKMSVTQSLSSVLHSYPPKAIKHSNLPIYRPKHVCHTDKSPFW